MNYTKRDHDTFRVLDAHAEGDTVVLPNRILAKELGISPGAAVPRLDRLRDLGVIKIDYQINTYNGNVKLRTITLLNRPAEPYSKPAQKEKAVAEPAQETTPEVQDTELRYEGSNEETVQDPTASDW